MNPRETKSHFSNPPTDRTTLAIQNQVTAMAADVFEIGLFKPDAGPTEPQVAYEHRNQRVNYRVGVFVRVPEQSVASGF
jgi:hypothetical protein